MTSEDPAVSSEPEVPAPAPLRWSEREPGRATAVYLLAYLALAAAGGRLALLTSHPVLLSGVVTIVGLGCTVLALFLVLSLCRISFQPWVHAALLAGMTGVVLVARPDVTAALLAYWHVPARVILLPRFPDEMLVGNLGLILWATLLGKWVAGVIREGNLLLPVAVAAALMDVVTVFWGPVAKASQTAPNVVAALSVKAPAAEVMALHNLPVPVLMYIGVGDFLFLAVFLTATLRHRMRPAASLWAAFVSMLVASFVVRVSPAPWGIPGLPFLSTAVLIVNWRFFRFSREEKRALIFVALLVVALIAAGVVLLLRK